MFAVTIVWELVLMWVKFILLWYFAYMYLLITIISLDRLVTFGGTYSWSSRICQKCAIGVGREMDWMLLQFLNGQPSLWFRGWISKSWQCVVVNLVLAGHLACAVVMNKYAPVSVDAKAAASTQSIYNSLKWTHYFVAVMSSITEDSYVMPIV